MGHILDRTTAFLHDPRILQHIGDGAFDRDVRLLKIGTPNYYVWCAQVRVAPNGPGTYTLKIPLTPLVSSQAQKGCWLSAVTIWYEIDPTPIGAAMALDVTCRKVTLPANNTAWPKVTSLAFTYDSGHLTTSSRYNGREHKMTITFTTPLWMISTLLFNIEIACTDFYKVGEAINFYYYGLRPTVLFRL